MILPMSTISMLKSSFRDPKNFLAFFRFLNVGLEVLLRTGGSMKTLFRTKINLGKMCEFIDHQLVCPSKMTTILSSPFGKDIFLTS